MPPVRLSHVLASSLRTLPSIAESFLQTTEESIETITTKQANQMGQLLKQEVERGSVLLVNPLCNVIDYLLLVDANLRVFLASDFTGSLIELIGYVTRQGIGADSSLQRLLQIMIQLVDEEEGGRRIVMADQASGLIQDTMKIVTAENRDPLARRMAAETILLLIVKSPENRERLLHVDASIESIAQAILHAPEYPLQASLTEIVFRITRRSEKGKNRLCTVLGQERAENLMRVATNSFQDEIRTFLCSLNESLGSARKIYTLPTHCLKIGTISYGTPYIHFCGSSVSFWIEEESEGLITIVTVPYSALCDVNSVWVKNGTERNRRRAIRFWVGSDVHIISGLSRVAKGELEQKDPVIEVTLEPNDYTSIREALPELFSLGGNNHASPAPSSPSPSSPSKDQRKRKISKAVSWVPSEAKSLKFSQQEDSHSKITQEEPLNPARAEIQPSCTEIAISRAPTYQRKLKRGSEDKENIQSTHMVSKKQTAPRRGPPRGHSNAKKEKEKKPYHKPTTKRIAADSHPEEDSDTSASELDVKAFVFNENKPIKKKLCTRRQHTDKRKELDCEEDIMMSPTSEAGDDDADDLQKLRSVVRNILTKETRRKNQETREVVTEASQRISEKLHRIRAVLERGLKEKEEKYSAAIKSLVKDTKATFKDMQRIRIECETVLQKQGKRLETQLSKLDDVLKIHKSDASDFDRMLAQEMGGLASLVEKELASTEAEIRKAHKSRTTKSMKGLLEQVMLSAGAT